MLVEAHKNGSAEIEIYDDYICSRDESIKILERAAANMLRQLNLQRNKKVLEQKNETV